MLFDNTGLLLPDNVLVLLCPIFEFAPSKILDHLVFVFVFVFVLTSTQNVMIYLFDPSTISKLCNSSVKLVKFCNKGMKYPNYVKFCENVGIKIFSGTGTLSLVVCGNLSSKRFVG